jgi:hypothetical protein
MTDHFDVGTWYRVVQFEDGMFGVEVTKPSCRPYMVNISKKEVGGEAFGGFVRLRAVVGAFYWISFDGMRVLRGREPRGADELRDGFIEAMAREGSER